MNKGNWLFKGWIIAAVCLIGSIAGYGQKRSYAPTSVLATGKWYKISVAHSGVHRLTYDDLVSIGLDTPSKVRIFGNGGSQLPYDSGKPRTDDLVECPVTFFKGSDGVFNSGDWIVFYAQGPVIWKYDATRQMFLHRLHLYSDLTYYFLTDDLGQAISVPEETTPDQPATTVVTEYDDYDFREKDSLNLIKSGRQWAWKHFAIQLRWGFNFSFPNRLAGAPVKVLSSLWARSSRNSQNSKFFLEEGDSPFQTIDLPGVNTNNYEALYASTAVTQSEFSPADNNFRLNIQFNPSNPAAEGWLDYLDLNTRSALRYRDTPLFFRDLKSTGAGSIASFSIQEAHAGMMVWDVTNPQKIKRMATSLSNRILSFKATADSLHEYILFDPSDPDLPVPVYQGEGVGEIANQNLHGMEAPDMIIIVHEGLKSYAQQLADYHHEKDGLVSQLVTPDEIYNEFSSGIPDVSAIRDFLKMFFDRAGNQPMKLKYLLLFGDGSYDNKGIGKTFKTCLPTYQSLESLYPTSSYLSDDFYGLLGDHDEMESGKLDLGIGRLPVLTENDAAIVVDKILHYKDRSTFGDWRNLVCFIGDDEDGNGHMRDANILADKLRDEYPAFNVDKIFLDAYQQVSVPAGERYPEVNRAINDRVRKGALIINYLGHGSERGLAHEEILTTSDIKNWTNKNRLPLFMTATCEFSRFDDIELVSAGEWVLLNPNGGGIALFSTTRLVYSSPNFRLNKLFYDYIFKTNATGKPNRLGDVMRLTKNAVGSELNKLSFSLLGDPALTLDFPENEIRMTEINDQPVNTFKDTLKALSKVKISGYISNHQG
ncbi:MAG: type IX secretion system sortase PorU, partial [Bacteroidales bacterium]|nr:type IX secretion system sortase PorU [Bacteroidales bacterium]